MSKKRKEGGSDRAIVKTLAKGLDLLDLVATARKPMNLTEIRKLFPSDPGTIHRMLNTLCDRGLILQDPETKRYSLDVKVFQLSRHYLSQYHVYERARGAVLALADASNETVQVTIPSSRQCAVLVDEYAGDEMIAVSGSLGMRLPFHCTAHGKALLAFLPAEVRERHLEQMTFEEFGPSTIVSRERLEKELAGIRRRGYACGDEEFMEGVRAVAAPVFDFTDHPVATLGIVGPASRFTRRHIENIAPLLIAKCLEASEMMGYCPSEEKAARCR